MRITGSLTIVLVLAVASPAWAVFGGGPKDPPASTPQEVQATDKPEARAEAEALYAAGYEEVAKAKKEIADGKTKNVEKRFRKALERGEAAVKLAPDYHEAWNLVGYSARKLKNFDRSIAAYEKCLAVKPDYAPAREYLGETYVETGDVTKARVQMVWLEKMGETAMVASLRGQIEAWEKEHPAAPAPAPAPADSTAPTSGSSGSH
jgi:tetratricopeptide (TPR) repeat protein